MKTEDAGAGFLAGARADRDAVEARCAELVDTFASRHEGIHEAIRYTLLGGGKRLRPLLCLWTFDAFAAAAATDRDAALDCACALECVHTYSLIHDDLPCMDDDDLRRGQPSAHVRFGEATAVLAGDALLTLAFEIITSIPVRHGAGSSARALEAARTLASDAGPGGLVAGQALDLESEGTSGADIALVDRIHEDKTARLIAAAMEMGAIMAGAPVAARLQAREAGLLAGRAFQIVDDLLDLAADEETLGKTPGKDVKEGKLTYPALVGMDEARARARALVEEAGERLGAVAAVDRTGRLQEAFSFIVERAA